MGPGSGWAGGLDSACREVEHFPVRGTYCHRADLVPVLPGDHSKELEPLRRQLLRRCCWQFPALQNLEVQAGTEGEGEGGAVLSPSVPPDPILRAGQGAIPPRVPHLPHHPHTLTFQSSRAFLVNRKGAKICSLVFFFFFFF